MKFEKEIGNFNELELEQAGIDVNELKICSLLCSIVRKMAVITDSLVYHCGIIILFMQNCRKI